MSTGEPDNGHGQESDDCGAKQGYDNHRLAHRPAEHVRPRQAQEEGDEDTWHGAPHEHIGNRAKEQIAPVQGRGPDGTTEDGRS